MWRLAGRPVDATTRSGVWPAWRSAPRWCAAGTTGPGGRHGVVALGASSLSVQSSRFVVRGERWRGRRRYAPSTLYKVPSAFFRTSRTRALLTMASARARAGTRARELGMGDSAVASTGDKAVGEAELACAPRRSALAGERASRATGASGTCCARGPRPRPPASCACRQTRCSSSRASVEDTGSSRDLVVVVSWKTWPRRASPRNCSSLCRSATALLSCACSPT